MYNVLYIYTDTYINIIFISQAQRSPSSTRRAESSSDLGRLRDLFFEITECKNDSQQRGWAVHDDQQAIMDVLEELLQILVSLGQIIVSLIKELCEK